MVVYESLPIHHFTQFSQQSWEAGKTGFIPIALKGKLEPKDITYMTCSHMLLTVVGFEARPSNSWAEGAVS